MRKYQKVQQDFSGGEISSRAAMRNDTDFFNRSGLLYLNFMPTMQGSLLRSPGSRFLYDIRHEDNSVPTNGRIIPFSTPDNKYAIVQLLPHVGVTDGDIRIFKAISSTVNGDDQEDPLAPAIVYRPCVENGKLNGQAGWDLTPGQWVSSEGDGYGWKVDGGGFNCTGLLREDGRDDNGVINTMKGSFTISENADHIIVTPQLRYYQNFSELAEGGADVHIYIGTTKGGSEIADIDLSFLNPVSAWYTTTTKVTYAFLAGTTYYITFSFEAVEVAGEPGDNGKLSQPAFSVLDMEVLAKVTATPDNESLSAVVPYTASEIQDIQYVQSPYPAQPPSTIGKELVIVHPNHPPKRLYFDGVNYVFEDIVFEFDTPFDWANKGYPAACTSFMGRLVLAGSTVDPVINDPGGSNTESVWCTKVGQWDKFTDPNADEILPEDSVTFTAIYRSPIHWVIGHKQLLVGAQSMEYTASADGIFQPGDLGVEMQSTHGSNRVQPVGMGQYVVFPAENGTKVRSMKYMADDEGWISPDLSIRNSDLLAIGIVRMVRMRNPHQMVVCLLTSGILALLHLDTNEGIAGWSRIDVEGDIKDICVQVDEDGFDVLYMMVERKVDGVRLWYMEAIPNFTDSGRRWVYMQCYKRVVGDESTNIVSGLNHFGHHAVQVIADGSYLGTYKPDAGQIALRDDIGNPLNYREVIVGYATRCRFLSNIVVGKSPSSKKSAIELTVRCRISYMPMIQGLRPPDRRPSSRLDGPEHLYFMVDATVSSSYLRFGEPIEISENIPVPIEVVAMFMEIDEGDM